MTCRSCSSTAIRKETPLRGWESKNYLRTLTLYNALLQGTDLQEVIVKTQCEGLDLVPADKNLVAANLDLVDDPRPRISAHQGSGAVRDRYRYILIDCPPALDLLTLNALSGRGFGLGSYPM